MGLLPGATVRSEDNRRVRTQPSKTYSCPALAVHKVAQGLQGCPSCRMFSGLRLYRTPRNCPPKAATRGHIWLGYSWSRKGWYHDGHCNFLLLQADPRGLGCPGDSFLLRSENAVVSMETKALEGLGAAFLPVPSTHTVNWVSLLGAGAGVCCSVHQRVQAIVLSDILQPCPASEPGILRGALRRS